jgi:GNAT superfamily N-acetyltransferase
MESDPITTETRVEAYGASDADVRAGAPRAWWYSLDVSAVSGSRLLQRPAGTVGLLRGWSGRPTGCRAARHSGGAVVHVATKTRAEPIAQDREKARCAATHGCRSTIAPAAIRAALSAKSTGASLSHGDARQLSDQLPVCPHGQSAAALSAGSAGYGHPVFREARREDLPAVLGLLRQLNADDPALEPSVARAAFESILDTPGLTVFVLEQDGALVASTYLNVVPNLTRAAAPYAVIENVVVDEGHRGQGLGKAIIARTLNIAWEAGCYKAMLQTGSRRPSTHAFYRACGFSGDEKHAYVAHPSRVL